jgi:rhodanese-related sulfurtransferase
MWRRLVLEMAALVLLASIVGVASNFFAAAPLPLLGPPPAAEDAAADEGRYAQVDGDFVAQLAGSSQSLVLDARLPELYRQGHIPGALNLPIARFGEFFPAVRTRLQPGAMVIVYCSGPTCHDSRRLARRLEQNGFAGALVYLGGLADWQEKQHELER